MNRAFEHQGQVFMPPVMLDFFNRISIAIFVECLAKSLFGKINA